MDGNFRRVHSMTVVGIHSRNNVAQHSIIEALEQVDSEQFRRAFREFVRGTVR